MFQKTKFGKIDLSSWDMSHIESCLQMFEGSKDLENVVFPKTFTGEHVKELTDMFSGCTSLKEVRFKGNITKEFLLEFIRKSGIRQDVSLVITKESLDALTSK